jgi:hypothetical protein
MSQPEARFNRRAGVGERILNDVPLEFDQDREEGTPAHPLDQAEGRKTLRKLHHGCNGHAPHAGRCSIFYARH